MTIVYGGGKRAASMYSLQMSNEKMSKEMQQFLEEVQADLEGAAEDHEPQRVLAAVKDGISGNYMLVMAVPSSALSDSIGPDIWRTPDEHRFLAVFSEDILVSKADEIQELFSTTEERNNAMAEYIGGFLPALFERAANLPKLTF